jgi:cobaltochelatase CobS
VAPPPEYPAREKLKYEIGETFGLDLGPEMEQTDPKDPNSRRPKIDPKTKKPVKMRRFIEGYKDKTPWVPDVDLTYEFDEEALKIALMAIEQRDRLLIHGHTGVGKTTLIEQIAARLNMNFVRVSCDGEIKRSDLVGEWVVIGQSMEFMWGILPLSFRLPGTIIVLDEWDSIGGDAAFVLQRPLEKNDGKLLVLETGGTLIPLHEDNVIAATANTRGLGDETGLYTQGTKVQNYAQLNRFQLTIELSWMAPAKEQKMLRKKFPDILDGELKQFMAAATKIREAYEHNELGVPLSPRDLINWVDKFLVLGTAERAAKYCFLNRMSKTDADTAHQIIQRAFA